MLKVHLVDIQYGRNNIPGKLSDGLTSSWIMQRGGGEIIHLEFRVLSNQNIHDDMLKLTIISPCPGTTLQHITITS